MLGYSGALMGVQDSDSRSGTDGVVPLLRLRLFDGFRATRDGGPELPERWPRPSARTLVKLLAVLPEHRLHREQAMDICWPDAEPQAAVGSLRVALHAARHALEPELAPRASSSYLISDGPMLALDPDTVWIDADAAEREARVALEDDSEPDLSAALALFTGELLPEDRYEPWAEDRRAALADLRRQVRIRLAGLQVGRGSIAEAIELAEEVLADAPAEEDAHRVLIQAYLAQGLRRSAVRQYHRCRQALETELGVRPDPETERLHQTALAARPAPVPARPSLPAQARVAPATELHGRDQLLDRLRSSAGPAMTVLTGDAGVGKTRLAAEVARSAVDSGDAVLWASGHAAAGQTPYAMFVDALDGWLAERSAAERARVGAEYPELAALLPTLGLAGIDGERTPEQERDRLFGAISLLLGGLADEQQVLFVLDDLHDGDVGSFQLLAHLARQSVTTGTPMRFLLTYREEALPEDDVRRAQLGALVRQRLAVRQAVEPLDEQSCRALMRDAGAHETAAQDRVWDLSLGNPLFALELARGFSNGDPDPTSTNIRELVAERVTRLDPDARRIVEIVAVAGGETTIAELLDVAAQGLHPPLAGAIATSAVERAIASAIVEERDVLSTGRTEPGLAFRHPLVRLVTYEQLTGVRRRTLHAAIAEAVLARRPDAVDALAVHFSQADDPRAAEFLRLAAERAAALYANDTADRYYRDLVRRLDIDAARARVAHSKVLRRMGDFEAEAETLRLALGEFERRGEPDDVVLTVAKLAETLLRMGDLDAARGVLLDHPVTSASGPEATATHELALSVLAGTRGDHQEGYDAATRALGAARLVPGAAGLGLVARAYANQATNLGRADRLEEARAAGDQALEPAEAYGDPTLLGNVLSMLRENAQRAGRLSDAVDFGARSLALAERSGDPVATAFEQANLAELKLLREEFDEARALAEAAVAGADWERAWQRAYALAALAQVMLRTGDPITAGALLDEADRSSTATGDRQARSVATAVRAELALSLGRTDDALRVLDQDDLKTSAMRAWAQLLSGDPDQALEQARTELDRAVRSGERLAEVEALVVLAAASGRTGDAAASTRELARAESLATELPYPAGLTRVRLTRTLLAEAETAQTPSTSE